MKWGRTDRPADQPQNGPVRDAARPGSYVGNVLGCCAREAASQLATADRRVVKLQPVPQEPCRRREEPASVQGALRPGCPRGRSERRSNRCECVLRGDRWESKARSYATGPGFGGLEPSRFLGRETLEKPDNDLSITPHLSVGKGFGASPAKVFDPVQFSSEKLHFTSGKVW